MVIYFRPRSLPSSAYFGLLKAKINSTSVRVCQTQVCHRLRMPSMDARLRYVLGCGCPLWMSDSGLSSVADALYGWHLRKYMLSGVVLNHTILSHSYLVKPQSGGISPLLFNSHCHSCETQRTGSFLQLHRALLQTLLRV